jgi:ectoine hydroxylase-related dioxygenase (phytanoyl-CoA dioxygenase family)
MQSIMTSTDINFEHHKKELDEKGYTVVENVLTQIEIDAALASFNDWMDSNDQIKAIHNNVSPHGIIKHFEVGHQRHAWLIRTNPRVQSVFKYLWNTDELVVSYDGCCWLDENVKKKDNIWTHTDQSPNKKDVHCYQAFVPFTHNVTRTLVVFEGSHLLHEQYFAVRGITDSKDWQLIDHDFLDSIAHTKRVIEAKPGSLVIWESRTFHQNQYGPNPERRIVQYVSYMPKSMRSQKMKEKREKYFRELRTTSHWATPVKVNGKQPQTYGKEHLKIDYSKLRPPNLDDLMPEIVKLI